MRLAPLVALLLAAPALHAQPCTPDPVPASDYYPLNVGDEWVYHAPAFASSPEAYVQRRVLRAEAATGQVVEQTCTVSIPDGTRTCGPERASAIPDGLGAPLGSSPLGTCAADLGTSVVIGGTAYTVARVKGLPAIDFPPPPFAAGVGPVGLQVGNLVERTDRFEYARVGGVEYGQRPVAGESGAAPAAALALGATPNPTTGALRLALTLPEAQTVRLEAFDALGRRVWQLTAALGAGAQSVPVDASAWAPGVYVVRALAGRASASARIVRR